MTRIKLVFQIPVLGPRGDVGVNLTLKCLYLHSEGNFSFDEGGGGVASLQGGLERF